MKILPTMNKSVVLVHGDGSFELAPMQVFKLKQGFVLRLGSNVYFFNEDGTYDGSEHKLNGVAPDSPEAAVIREAVAIAGDSKGLPPEVPYFMSGTPPHARETAAWGVGRQTTGSGQTYEARVPSKGKTDVVGRFVRELVKCAHERFGTLVVVREDNRGRCDEEQSTCIDCGAVLVGSEWFRPEGLVRLRGAVGTLD